MSSILKIVIIILCFIIMVSPVVNSLFYEVICQVESASQISMGDGEYKYLTILVDKDNNYYRSENAEDWAIARLYESANARIWTLNQRIKSLKGLKLKKEFSQEGGF